MWNLKPFHSPPHECQDMTYVQVFATTSTLIITLPLYTHKNQSPVWVKVSRYATLYDYICRC